MKKVLVTGANGYIGRHVVEKLLDMGHEVYACDFKFDNVDKRAKLIKEDIFSGDNNIFNILNCPDVCIHLAWRDGFVHNSNAHMEDLSKHYIFLKNMILGGLKNLSVMGSMHEVGYFEGAVDENTQTNPLSMYGIAKNSLRQAISLFVKDKEVRLKWLRAYYILGDDLNNNSIFSKILKANNEGKKTFPFTTGKNKYDFLDIEDLANQIAISAIQEEIVGVINCCSGKGVSLAEMVESFISKNNLNIKLEYGVFPDREYDSPGIWGNSDKINAILKNSKVI
ncbi:NAD-dependent epimerase/dehydratase family protein [Clostridium perfringens]|nr:NAD(P)-dependent oxidoreductase [Clostridium perfringens]